MVLRNDKKQEAIRALIRLAIFEGLVLTAVVAVYIMTWNLTYFIGGLIGTAAVFAPAWIGWIREHAPALKSDTTEGSGQ